jgi:hypothetical protein
VPQFLTSLAISLLIRLERDAPRPRPGCAFALVALALCPLLSTNLARVAADCRPAGRGGMIVAANLNPREENDPATTVIARAVLQAGRDDLVRRQTGCDAGNSVTALLYFKPELRGLSQTHAPRSGCRAAIFRVTFIVLPILPDQITAPMGFNPHQAWLMVVLISGISLAGYAALHVVGTRYGAPLLGMFGGLTSSTATTLIYARHGKHNLAALNLAASVIVIASMVLPLRLLAVSAVVARGILSSLIPVLVIGLLFGLIVALYNWHKMDKATELFIPETTNPAELHTAVGFGLLYVGVLLGAAWMADMPAARGCMLWLWHPD